MSQELRATIERLTSELHLLNKCLQSESPGGAGSLGGFREALDAIRLTVWTAHELAKAREDGQETAGVLVVTANERARRCGQMAVSLCADLDAGFLKRDSAREALIPGIESLRGRLLQHA